MVRIFRLCICLLIAGLFLVGQGQAASAGPKGELVIGTEAETSSLDPMKAWVTYGLIVSRLLYDAPISFGPNGELTPALAEKWEIIDDNTWRFHLRKDAKFHNGYPVLAEDVKFTVERIQDPANKCRFRTRYANFKEVKVIDDHTFDIITKSPDSLLPNRVAFFVRVVSKKWVQENGKNPFAKTAMGTGPFKFVSWSRKDRMVLEANPDYYLGAPKVKRVVIRPIPEMAARMAELRAGGIQIATHVAPFLIPQLEKDPNLNIQKVPASRTLFMVMNTRDVEELKNPLVRQALNYAIDKKGIISGIMSGLGNPVGLPAPPTVAGVDKSIAPYEYNPAKAMELLKKAGYADGFELNVYSPSGRYPMDKEVAQAIADQLSQVGIKAKLKVMETQKYFRTYIKHKMKGIALIGFGYAYADQDSMVNFLLSNATYSYFTYPGMDEMVAKMRSELNREKRYQTAHEIQRITHEKCPMLFLFNLVNVYGVSDKVAGFKARSDDFFDLNQVTVR